MTTFQGWLRRNFSNPQVVLLTVLLLIGVAGAFLLPPLLVPLVAAAVLAFILEGPVARLERRGLGRTTAVVLVFVLFVSVLLFLVFWVAPLLFRQVTLFLQFQAPAMVGDVQRLLLALPDRFPLLVDEARAEMLVTTLRDEMVALTRRMLSASLASLAVVAYLVAYLVLVPFLIFFFLKDKARIFAWIGGLLPADRGLVDRVWSEASMQFARYIRGKVWEIVIVGAVTYVVFTLLGLKYAALLATLTGLSVLVPYFGVAVVTLPVAAVAYGQWGWSLEFGYVLLAYGIIQLVDGNILAPLLFSEVVKIHPVAIVVAVLFFGAIWGFWGVFFAIPLATLVQVVIRAWPRPVGGEGDP